MAAIRRQGAPVDADLVIDAGAVITADASAPVLRDASIVIVDGAIAAVGPTAEIRSAWHGRNTLDARRDIVTPGFIDSHVHLSHHLGRTSIPDVWPESREHDHWLPYWRNLSEEDQYQSTLLACLEMVRNGTTTFCDMSGRHDASVSAAAADEVGMRGMVSEVCWDIPPYQEVAIGDTEACVARLERLIERFPMAPDKRIWAGVGMTGMGKCSDTLVTAGRELARRHGLVMYMHQSFGEADVVAFRAMAGGVTATEHLRDLDVLGPDLMLIHMVRTEKPEVDLLASTGTSVVHCPGASVRWGMGVSPVRAVAGDGRAWRHHRSGLRLGQLLRCVRHHPSGLPGRHDPSRGARRYADHQRGACVRDGDDGRRPGDGHRGPGRVDRARQARGHRGP